MAGMGSAGAAPAPMSKMSKMQKGDGAAAPDLNDVKYDAFLANDRTLADPEVVKVEPGGRVLMRIINSSSMSAYHIDLGDLDGELIAVDGFAVAPVRGRSFPIAVAQRLDIRLALPGGSGAYPVLALLEGERNRTGIVLVAGNGPVARIADQADAPSPALTLDLESRLSAAEPLAPRKADRVHNLYLTGEMAGYVWSINDVVWNKDVPPLPVAKGERVELVMVNRTPMPHPMHLHGHEFSGRRDRRRPIRGRRARHRAGPARPAGGGGLRRRQPGLMGLPLPPALSPRRGHVHHLAVRVTLRSARSSLRPHRARRRSPGVGRALRRGRAGASEPRRAG